MMHEAETERDGQITCVTGLALSDGEIFNLGRIVAYWGYIEHEVFRQAVIALPERDEIPKKVNNIQFTTVLDFWKKLVIEPETGERREKLERTLSRILHYHEYRPGLVHAMWEWDRADPSVIVSTRAVMRKVITTRYTGNDLEEMATELGSILFDLQNPGGIEEHVHDVISAGGYMSRHFVAMITGHPNPEQFLRHEIQDGLRKTSDENNRSGGPP